MKNNNDSDIRYELEIAEKCPEGYRVLGSLELIKLGDYVWNTRTESFERVNLGDWHIHNKADRTICAVRKV